MAITLNRGVTSRPHPSGMRIYAYNDEPGNFYDERGTGVSRELAKQAGFDVSGLLKMQEKHNRLQAFKDDLEREYSQREAEIEEALDEGLDIRPLKAGGYTVFRDGSPVTGKTLTWEEALELAKGLGDGDEDTQSDAAPAAKKPAAGRKARGGKAAAAAKAAPSEDEKADGAAETGTASDGTEPGSDGLI